MSRFNHLMQDHFRTCQLLAKGHDEHRNRDVEIREIPGALDVFGISDGVDAWIAPKNVISDLFERARKSLTAIYEGREPSIDAPARRKRRVLIEDDEPQTPTKKERARVDLT